MNRAANLLRTSLISQAPKRGKAYLGPMKGTMNDLPQPGGSFKTQYDATQRKYNAHLILGASFLLLTIGFGQSVGLFYFNTAPPARPADKVDYGK